MVVLDLGFHGFEPSEVFCLQKREAVQVLVVVFACGFLRSGRGSGHAERMVDFRSIVDAGA